LFDFKFKGDLSKLTDGKHHRIMHQKYGRIMKITGIPGRKNIVMLFDPDDIEKVSVYRSS
jgi:hypothetical protein